MSCVSPRPQINSGCRGNKTHSFSGGRSLIACRPIIERRALTTFKSPFIFLVECDGFGPLNHLLGGTKDSQITASSSHIRNFLPYSAKFEEDISGWMPLRGSGGELHTVHFMQVDLRYVIQTKFVVSIAQTTQRLVKLQSKDYFIRPIHVSSALSVGAPA